MLERGTYNHEAWGQVVIKRLYDMFKGKEGLLYALLYLSDREV